MRLILEVLQYFFLALTHRHDILCPKIKKNTYFAFNFLGLNNFAINFLGLNESILHQLCDVFLTNQSDNLLLFFTPKDPVLTFTNKNIHSIILGLDVIISIGDIWDVVLQLTVL